MWKKPLRNVRTAVFVAVQCPSDGPVSIDQSNWKIDKSNVKCRKQDGKYGNTEKIPPNIRVHYFQNIHTNYAYDMLHNEIFLRFSTFQHFRPAIHIPILFQYLPLTLPR